MKIYKVELKDVTSRAQLHEALKRGLELPEYYGNNLDALWDCLTSDLQLPCAAYVLGLEALPEEIRPLGNRVMELMGQAAAWHTARGRRMRLVRGEMLIRDCAEADEEAWRQLRAACLAQEPEALWEEGDVCLAAEEDGKIIGGIRVRYIREEDKAVIRELMVLPECRRARVATALWRAAKARLSEVGARRCEGWAAEGEARLWYAASGFTAQDKTLLRCRAGWTLRQRIAGESGLGEIEEIVFLARDERREELKDQCDAITRLRLYACKW